MPAKKSEFTRWTQYIEQGSFSKKIEIWVPENGIFKEFSEDYAKYYFINKKECDNDPVKKQYKSCRWVEDVIIELKDKEEWVPLDILRLLAWKTGKIRHNECENEKEKPIRRIKYADGWNEEELRIQLPYQEPVYKDHFCKFANEVTQKRKQFREERDANKTWKELLSLANGKIGLRGLGTVYLITLFSFLTSFKYFEYPIFDRFAMASLISLEMKDNNVIVPGNSIIKGCSLPDRKNAEGLLEENSLYMKYKEMLDKRFGFEWKKNRTIDQALWSYGHCFIVD